MRSADTIKAEIDRLNILFQKSRISFEYYDKEYSKLETELKEVSLTIPQIMPSQNNKRVESVLKTDFRSMYASISPENRLAFWRQIIGQIHLTEDSRIDHVDFI